MSVTAGECMDRDTFREQILDVLYTKIIIYPNKKEESNSFVLSLFWYMLLTVSHSFFSS